ncbi:MAG: signal peptidase II [Deltaproteobacteria bacterium]|nr:signal peptidase II [Deltaproteobacteria bacterium]
MSDALKKPIISILLIFVLGIAADQGTKQWAQHSLLSDSFHQNDSNFPVCGNPDQEMTRARFVYTNAEPKTVVNNMFRFRYVENCASAFNLMGNLPEGFRFPFFLIISILACVVIPFMFFKTPNDQRLMLYALPFILTGALGNLLDRMFFRYVIDFIDWYVVLGGKEYHWPTFNIADAAIVIGIALMILQILLTDKKKESSSSEHEKKLKEEPVSK